MLYGGHVYVGLTGGIGSGKSTAAQVFADLGAVVIDADECARSALDLDSPLIPRLIETFGTEIVGDQGVNRQALADIVFSDPQRLAELESMIHPEVSRRVAAIRKSLPTDAIVMYDVPLLVEKNMASQFDAVIVIRADIDLRLERLALRGISREDALARIANQASDEERAAVADYVIDNSADLGSLKQHCLEVWSDLTA